MTHPKLIEAAKAISGLTDAEWDALPKRFGDLQGQRCDTITQADYLEDVRAVIQALIEPDDDLVIESEAWKVPATVDLRAGEQIGSISAIKVWEAMLQTILDDKDANNESYRARRTAKIARLEAENAEMHKTLSETKAAAALMYHASGEEEWAMIRDRVTKALDRIARNAIGEKQP